LKEAVQPLALSPTMMLGRTTVIGSRSAYSRTSVSDSNFDSS
jgi:hypothetical protein